jgi:hypothetical protein
MVGLGITIIGMSILVVVLYHRVAKVATDIYAIFCILEHHKLIEKEMTSKNKCNIRLPNKDYKNG